MCNVHEKCIPALRKGMGGSRWAFTVLFFQLFKIMGSVANDQFDKLITLLLFIVEQVQPHLFTKIDLDF